MQTQNYEKFLSGITEKQWKRLGVHRRAGVTTPLFSLHSAKSAGIGEFSDLELLAEWCVRTRMSIIQLLPLNDIAFRFAPYDAASTFALDPMYLRPEKIEAVDTAAFKEKIEKLREAFPAGKPRVDYGIKGAKLELFWEMFRSSQNHSGNFEKFRAENAFWLEDYALFKAIKEAHHEAGWESWDEGLRKKDPAAIAAFKKAHENPLLFHQWLQWQAFLQASEAKRLCTAKGVFLMGDLPFLVSRDSADVWAHQAYFKLDRVSGAPPDAFFANGQRWGMPPYDWPKIAGNQYDYLIQKVRYAQNFYDMFRIDHVVGTFRLWTIHNDEPSENGGLHGVFDPQDENIWEEHGRKILSVMIQSADMLPCAEDLGVVPPCSYKVLEEFNVPGMDVQRWARDWGSTYDFKNPDKYRANSMAIISNHDTTSFPGWWSFEAGTVDEVLFSRRCREAGIDFEKIKPRVFDLEHSKHGRLRWKEEISDTGKLAAQLEKSEREAGGVIALYLESYGEKEKFLRFLELPEAEKNNIPVLIEAALRKANGSVSVFSVQLLQDLLSVDGGIKEDPWEFRINFPGTTGPQNWSLVLPWSLEKMLEWQGNRKLRQIHDSAGRI